MHILRNKQARPLCSLGLLLWSLTAAVALADFEIEDAEAFVSDGLLQVDADANLVIPAETREALDSGVDLRIQFLVELSRDRRWIWDKQVSRWEMLFTLHFQQLSNQYILATPQSDSIQSFNTLEQALDAIEAQLSFNLGYQAVLKSEQALRLRIRIRLDTQFLPAPLRLMALVSRNWKLDSGWKAWTLAHTSHQAAGDE